MNQTDRLYALQAGVPIYATPGRRGGYAIDVQNTLPPLNLTAAEVAAVATALAADTATPFTCAGRAALQKILAVLGEVDAEGVRELASPGPPSQASGRPGRPTSSRCPHVEVDRSDRAGLGL